MKDESITLDYEHALRLFDLAVLTEDRTPNEQEAIDALALALDLHE